jgi:hypothetical protein
MTKAFPVIPATLQVNSLFRTEALKPTTILFRGQYHILYIDRERDILFFKDEWAILDFVPKLRASATSPELRRAIEDTLREHQGIRYVAIGGQDSFDGSGWERSLPLFPDLKILYLETPQIAQNAEDKARWSSRFSRFNFGVDGHTLSEEGNILRELEHRYEYFQGRTYPRPEGVRVPRVVFLNRVRWREMFEDTA